MSRPPLTPGELADNVSVKMSADDHSWLAQIAKARGISKSEVVRRIIAERRRRELEREEQGPPGEGGQPPDN